MKSLTHQHGGNHYVTMTIQPWMVIDSHGLNFYEGNILKYLLRRKGNRVEDLKKLIHYAEHLVELEEGKISGSVSEKLSTLTSPEERVL